MAKDKLLDLEVRRATARDLDYKLTDGGGLYLLVKANGTKCWRLAYRFAQKQKTLSLGVYPTVSLKDARKSAAEAKAKLHNNIDPSMAKQHARHKSHLDANNTFEPVARAWWEKEKGRWKPKHANKIIARLESNAFPLIGAVPISELKPPIINNVIRQIEIRGALDVAKRVLQDIKRIYSHAVKLGYAEVNPARELSSQSWKVKHRDSLPPYQLPIFLRDVESYGQRGRLLTKLALDLLMLTFVRSKELREAPWAEFHIEAREWRISGERMKMNTDHIVPLANQALAVLEQIRLITGQHEYLFPSDKRKKKNRGEVKLLSNNSKSEADSDENKFMSDGTLRLAIFRLGYDGKTSGKARCVPHGLRATACSILNEQGFNPDAVERQMSHMERNGVRAAYIHHAQFKKDRIGMMQWWANYLDEQRETKT